MPSSIDVAFWLCVICQRAAVPRCDAGRGAGHVSTWARGSLSYTHYVNPVNLAGM